MANKGTKLHASSCLTALGLSVVLPGCVPPSAVVAGATGAIGALAANLLSNSLQRHLDGGQNERSVEAMPSLLATAVHRELSSYAVEADQLLDRRLGTKLAKLPKRTSQQILTQLELSSGLATDLKELLVEAASGGELPSIESRDYWESYLIALADSADLKLPNTVKVRLAGHLQLNVWQAVRRELAEDFANNGPVYGDLQLAFMGDVLQTLRASEAVQGQLEARLAEHQGTLIDIADALDRKRELIIERGATSEAVARADTYYREQSEAFQDVRRDISGIKIGLDEVLVATREIQSAVEQGAQAPDIGELIADYLGRLDRRFGRILLPNLTGDQVPQELPIGAVFVDVPLRVTHASSTNGTVEESAEEYYFQERRSYTSSYLYENAPGSVAEAETSEIKLQDQIEDRNQSVIVGPPGSGKSTLLAALVIAASYGVGNRRTGVHESLLGLVPHKQLLPVVLVVRELPRSALHESLAQMIVAQLSVLGFDRERAGRLGGALLDRLGNGTALLLVDGLDEILARDERFRFAATISEFSRRNPWTKVLITSRPAGFGGMEVLLAHFDHLNFAAVSHFSRCNYVERLAGLFKTPPPAQEVADTQQAVTSSRLIARLCENMLAMSLLTQMYLTHRSAPATRFDVFQQVVRLLIKNQRRRNDVELKYNDVCPPLEALAYQMREDNAQSWPESKLIETLGEAFRESPAACPGWRGWLEHIVANIGILQVAGQRYDELSGTEETDYQFFHGSFQEYFAGQAMVHGRTDIVGDVVDQFRERLISLEIDTQRIDGLANGTRLEPVAGGEWRETLRHAIGNLNTTQPEVAGLALQTILSSRCSTPSEARAVSVLALECLADAPNVKQKLAERVMRAAIDSLRIEDGVNLDLNTTADIAFVAIASGPWGGVLENVMLHEFQLQSGLRRRYICNVLSLLQDLDESSLPSVDELLAETAPEVPGEMILVWVRVMSAAFRRHRNMGDRELFTPGCSPDSIAHAVVDMGQPGALRAAAVRALSWMVAANCIVRRGAPDLTVTQFEVVRDVLANDPDPSTRLCAVSVLGTQAGIPWYRGNEWVYECAVQADGVVPRAAEPKRPPTPLDIVGREELEALVQVDGELMLRAKAAQALGRCSILIPEMVQPLLEGVFLDESKGNDERSEAVFYAFQCGDPEERLFEWSGGPANFVAERSLLALSTYGSVAMLERCLQRGTVPSGKPDLFAYALAALGTATAEAVLETAAEHLDPDVLAAVEIANNRRADWRTVPEGPTKFIRGQSAHMAISPRVRLIYPLPSTAANAYWFLFVDRDKVDSLEGALEGSVFDLEDYGNIIESGFGDDIFDRVDRKLKNAYNFKVGLPSQWMKVR